MNHFCTYFDRGFLIQGLALWRSIAAHDPDATLWVLALDDFAAEALREIGSPGLRVATLAEVEAADDELRAARATRTRVEYYFTLSPCWPRWILMKHADVARVTYVDADMFFFANPAPLFAAMDAAGASVLVTGHRFPEWLQHYERHGKFNVGILSFRNDAAGRGCLDDWRERCLAWCFDRLEDGKYADQKYLDDWPARLGAALLVLDSPGVNLAPWNWLTGHVDLRSLIVFHFARLHPLRGDWWWHSGQLEYGVMPRYLRRAIYTPYVQALLAVREEIRVRRPAFDFVRRRARAGRDFWRNLPVRVAFGGDWLKVGDEFWNLRLGLGRWSGQCRAKVRNIFLRK